VHMFAEDGTLMATASQSCIVRFWKGTDDEFREHMPKLKPEVEGE